MYLSEEVMQAISLLIGNIIAIQPVSGGSINQCFQVTTSKGRYFLKTHSAEPFPDFFLCETEGLKKIRETKTIGVPQVISHGQAGEELFMILEWIEKGNNDSASYLMGATSGQDAQVQLAQLRL